MKYLKSLNIMTPAILKIKAQASAKQNSKAKKSKVAKKSP
tara:strand:- start:285 stop:404 length:120 start_codon:yes stop_codon:yes gene_type:complete